MEIDVALVPSEARVDGAVLVVVDQIRASTTLTTLLDLGVADLWVTGSVAAARRLARETGSLLAGEFRTVKPRGFDFDNSPTEIARADVQGRRVVLCTTNGTAILARLRGAAHVLIGCIRNASAVADAAARLAGPAGGVQVVCAGSRRRFVLDDAVAAGSIVARLVACGGPDVRCTDAAVAAVRLRDSYPDALTAMQASHGGATLRRIGQSEDIEFCAADDLSSTVPVLVPGEPMRIGRHAAPGNR